MAENKKEEKKADLVWLEVEGARWGAGAAPDEKDETEEILTAYDKLMEDHAEFDLNFATASAVGILSLMDGSVRIRMRPEEMDGPVWSSKSRMMKKQGRQYTTQLLAKTYRVSVVKVDHENKIVFVSERAAHADLKRAVIDRISDVLGKGSHPVVPARVIGTCPGAASLVMVSVGDVGIPGVIRRENWSKAYVANLEESAAYGKMITVAVTGVAPWSEKYGINHVDDNKAKIYECSRAEALLHDPWEGVEKLYPVRTGVRVRCLRVRGSEKFFASIDGLEDVTASCVVQDGPDGPSITQPEVGKEYLGYVYRVSEQDHMLRIRVFEEVEEPAAGGVGE